MNRIVRNWTSLILAIFAVTFAFLQFGNSRLEAAPEPAANTPAEQVTFTATVVFGLAQGQKARFCVGTVGRGAEPLDWTVPISDERGVVLLELPQTHSPAGEWRCLDVPRSSIPASGEPTTGRVQVAARELIKAPRGTRTSDIVASFELVNADGTTAGAIAGIVIAATSDN